MCPSQRTLPGKYDTRDMGVNQIVYTVSKYAIRPQKELHFAKKRYKRKNNYDTNK